MPPIGADGGRQANRWLGRVCGAVNMSHHSEYRPAEHEKKTAKPHVKWITIVGVVLMLAAILMYVFSMDEEVQPGEPLQQPVPAAE